MPDFCGREEKKETNRGMECWWGPLQESWRGGLLGGVVGRGAPPTRVTAA